MSRQSNWGQLLQIHEIRILLTGALLVSSLLVTLALVGGYLHTHAVGRHDFTATVSFDDGTGLGKGTKVLVRGIEAGTVEQINLNDSGQVVMTLRIPETFRSMIRTNWVCYAMRDRNLVSDRVLNIDDTAIDPKTRRENLKKFRHIPMSGDIAFRTAQGRDVESMMQEVTLLATEAQKTIDRVNAVLDRINDTTGSVGLLLNRKEAYVTGMQALKETREAIAQGKIVLSQGSEGIGTLVRTGTLVERRTPLLLDSVQLLLSSVSRSARAAERIAGRGDTIAGRAQELLERTGDLLDRSDRVLDGASNTWPLRSMLRNSGSKADAIPASPLP